VVRSTRSREYVHVDLSGEQVVEEREITADVAEHVTCRWCGSVDRVELVPRPGAEPELASAPTESVGSVVPPA
jgi:hypothetical protein